MFLLSVRRRNTQEFLVFFAWRDILLTSRKESNLALVSQRRELPTGHYICLLCSGLLSNIGTYLFRISLHSTQHLTCNRCGYPRHLLRTSRMMKVCRGGFCQVALMSCRVPFRIMHWCKSIENTIS